MSHPRARAGLAKSLCVLLPLLLGCGGSRPPAGVDLAALLPVAEVESEQSVLRFGSPLARGHLVSGWSLDEGEGEETYVWSVGASSVLRFFVSEPRRLELELVGQAFSFDGAPAQEVAVRVNEHDAGRVTVSGELVEPQRLGLEAEWLRVGQNTLTLTYGYHRQPAELDASEDDTRSLGVRWVRVAFSGLGSERPISVGSSEQVPRLVLQPRQRLSYFFDAEPGSEVFVESVAAPLSLGVGSRLRLEAASGELTAALEAVVGSGPVRLPLPVEDGRPVRISFSVDPDAGSRWDRLWARAKSFFAAPTDDGLVVSRPTLVVAKPPGGGEIETSTGAAARRPNIFVYLIDTLRADHLGTYGYERPTSPNIDRFGERATVFLNAQAQSSWTRTAVTSIFTGLNPQSHQVNGRQDMLPLSIETLAEHLQQAGYLTIGYVTNGNVDGRFAMGQGFDYYIRLYESPDRPQVHHLSDEVNEQIFRFLDDGGWEDKPFFLYIHVTDPHAPYTPPEPFRSRFAPGVDPKLGYIDHVRPIAKGEMPAPPGTREAFIDLYDGEIAFNDHHFGRLLEKLEEHELLDPGLMILLSDHGEEFLDHGGWEHGRTLNGDQLNVPLIVKLPEGEGAGQRVRRIARQVDVLPTILDYLSLETSADLDGASLLPVMQGATGGDSPISYSLLTLDERTIEAAVIDGWKLIQYGARADGSPTERLYHVDQDPNEQNLLGGEATSEAGYLRQVLRAQRYAQRLRTRARPEQAVLDDELRETLRNLGYIQ